MHRDVRQWYVHGKKEQANDSAVCVSLTVLWDAGAGALSPKNLQAEQRIYQQAPFSKDILLNY